MADGLFLYFFSVHTPQALQHFNLSEGDLEKGKTLSNSTEGQRK